MPKLAIMAEVHAIAYETTMPFVRGDWRTIMDDRSKRRQENTMVHRTMPRLQREGIQSMNAQDNDEPSFEKIRHKSYTRKPSIKKKHVPILGMVAGFAAPEKEQKRVRRLVTNAKKEQHNH
jgi:hypothetical protein